MQLIFFDDEARNNLLPFTHTRPVADIRCGILTMRERWELLLKASSSSFTENYLQAHFPLSLSDDNLFVNASVFGNKDIAGAVTALNPGEKLMTGSLLVACRIKDEAKQREHFIEIIKGLKNIEYQGNPQFLKNIWDIFSLNDFAIRNDFDLIISGKTSLPIPAHVLVNGSENIFLEEGAVIGAGCIINAQTGPVYIGKDAEIMEGAIIRGPFALCDHGVIKMGAKIYGATTIGPGCKAGGEISNVVFFSNSNKGHDGFLGNSVIGEWCNLGADTNCSNLKNNYDEIKIWNEFLNKSVKTGLQFCGLMMGDHSKSGINTMFNTGTVVGVSANIFGAGFPEKFIPSFTWGGYESLAGYDFDKATATADRMMARRNKALSKEEKKILQHVFNITQHQRDLFCKS